MQEFWTHWAICDLLYNHQKQPVLPKIKSGSASHRRTVQSKHRSSASSIKALAEILTWIRSLILSGGNKAARISKEPAQTPSSTPFQLLPKKRGRGVTFRHFTSKHQKRANLSEFLISRRQHPQSTFPNITGHYTPNTSMFLRHLVVSLRA